MATNSVPIGQFQLKTGDIYRWHIAVPDILHTSYALAFDVVGWDRVNAAAIIRVTVSRVVVRIRVRETIVRTIVPVTAETNSAKHVRVDKVSLNLYIPHIFRM